MPIRAIPGRCWDPTSSQEICPCCGAPSRGRAGAPLPRVRGAVDRRDRRVWVARRRRSGRTSTTRRGRRRRRSSRATCACAGCGAYTQPRGRAACTRIARRAIRARSGGAGLPSRCSRRRGVPAAVRAAADVIRLVGDACAEARGHALERLVARRWPSMAGRLFGNWAGAPAFVPAGAASRPWPEAASAELRVGPRRMSARA
jgi:hypothetical protein